MITGSGRDKGTLTRQDMALVDAGTGEQLSGSPPRASAETTIHAAVYRTTDARAVVHVHSPYATAVACRAGERTRTRMLPLAGFELLKGLGLSSPAATDLPVFPNWKDVPRIAADVAAHLHGTADVPPGFLIADHGITTWGDDLRQARNRLECLESICQLLLLTGTDPAHPRRKGEDS
jgi:ribulose-5-phosphate 4-epimerase/fuculose-1-phosphate aldolase